MRITKGKIIVDLFINIVGTFMLTAILQLIVYPFISSKISTANFGSMLTLMGISNAMATVFGGSLNNIKLIKQDYYKDGELRDFRIIINRIMMITIISILLVIIIFRNQINFIESIFLTIMTIFLILRGYMNSYYRINLDYKRITIHLSFAGFGYLIGLLIFNYIRIWSIVFCIGEVFAFIYAYKSTDFKFEKKLKSNNFDEINKDFIQLSSSNLISNLLLYLDRIIINPILGSSNVALYYIASLVGKTVGIILNPLASIILTYISKIKNISSRKIFFILTLTSVLMGVVVYVASIPISPIIIKILYSNQISEVKPYFNIANLSVILMVCGSLINPLLLKYAPMWWQNIIQFIYSIVYLGLGIILMLKLGLYGFCIAGAIANGSRFILIELLAYHYTKKEI